uniref:uncharacterized protein LOC105350078 n=1 Tax=Fragaria vesca subsp. vesca TaxID=101020 RepID=UPI0005C873B8|nr:PREDICTED: uncharacterized protein LOC105350078 [Fragaria vesca subsp. vesca]
MEIPDDHFPYVNISAPTSPAGMCSPHNNLCFYSVPSSPTGETSSDTTSPFGYQTDLNECPTPMSYHDANSYLDDDFEFDSCRSFSLNASDQSSQNSFGLDRKPRQRGDSLPTMAFADELFCDGKVMPLAPPLKLPPRLQRKRNEKLASQEGTGASVPGSPSNFVLKLPFGYKRLWNDDFDPFMVALKNVKEEKKEKASAASASYVANNQSTNEPAGDDEDSTTSAQEPISKEMGAQIVPKRQLAEPKGVEFARQVRLIQMGQMSKLDKLGKQSERDEKAESTRKKPTFLRKLNFKSGRAATCEEEKRVSHPRPHSQLSKMVLMHYKPRGIPCLGYN